MPSNKKLWVSAKPAAWCGAISIAVLLLSISMAHPTNPAEWLPLNDRSLEIVAGSPLDFSEFAGDLAHNGILTISGDRLTLNGAEPRINCAMLGPGFSTTPGSGFPDHPTAERYAEQLRRHGYNLVRFHHVDSLLMAGAKADFAFNPVQVDRLQYLMAALKKNGIRWSLDLMTSDNAALGGVFPNRWSERNGMRIRLYVERPAFVHWQKLMHKLLTTNNPYSHVAPANDPATAMVVLLNEGGITHQAAIAGKRFPDLLKPPYASWLEARGLDRIYADKLPALVHGGASMEQFQRFLNELQIAVTREMTESVRSAGYQGPVTAFASWPQLNAIPSRRDLALVDMHGYDQTPPGGKEGAQVRPISSFDDAGRYLQHIATTRFFGRPFIVTEHDQPFWNPYRYESGLAVPALASLQGWQFVCRHADGPINLAYDGVGTRKQALQPDGGGLDPVARAGETLTALLLLRGEIARARPQVGLNVSDAEALSNGGAREVPASLGATAWIARIGLFDARSTAAGVNPDLTMSVPIAPLAVSFGQRYANANRIVDKLRARGLLAPGNTTDPLHNRWESPGGQVLLLGQQRELRVTTRQTSALAFEKVSAPVTLGPLRIKSADSSALLSFSALDDQPLGHSRRILVIMASDARNTGMKIASDGTLIALGQLPLELRRVRVAATLAAPKGSAWQLTPLRLNGTLDTPIGLQADSAGLQVALDTALSPRGPTTFFLLERE
ncbi:hypothetical protein HHL08_22410 [Sphingobium sp. AR-3-1]|uniref:Glycoside hydrolase family 5 domain-containing protein n=1 Tax=Sphingobium psychrophilum TaxID=2728834 RepID=A0A7X9ZVN4_9SPHN|nr:hypothetical protein [Sphingobium psychrophilum]NML12851.1 hypothetical protein [Sphingobium psychrophilum]